MTGRLRNKISDEEIKQILSSTGNEITEAARRASEQLGESVSPQLFRYWTQTLPQEPREQKILVFDIEISPILAYVWGMWQQNVNIDAIKEDWYVICWAAKWIDGKKVMSHGGHREDELDIVHTLWDLLDQADAVVAHNAKRFDVKKMNAKFFQYGLPAPSYYRVIDTLQIAKGNFALTSNKLDFITKLCSNEGKVKTDFDLWLRCLNNEDKALSEMIKYCKKDVTELEKVYLELRAWDSSAPSYGIMSEATEPQCNVCGSFALTRVSEYTTGTSVFPVLRCTSCGHQQRSRHNTVNKDKDRDVNIKLV